MKTFDAKMLLLLSAGHMVTDIYQGALPAVLPFLKENLSLSYTMAGIILMASSFTSSLIQPLFGYLSDKREKPFLLPTGALFAGIGFSLLSVPSTTIPVIALVILSGMGVASFHPEGYKTASLFTGEKPVTGMSIFSVGGNLGFALGPILSVFIITSGGFSLLPVIVVPALLFAALILYNWRKISTGRKTVTAAEGTHSRIPGKTYLSVTILISIVMVRSWIQMGLMTYIPFYYTDFLKGNPLYASTLVSVFLLGGVLGTLGGAPIADRMGHKRYLNLAMFLTALLLPLIFFAKNTALFLVLGILGAILVSTFTVTIVMAQRLLPRNLGIASGLMVGFAIGAGGICVTLLGVLADHFGVPFALRSITILPLIGLILSATISYPERNARK